MQAAVAISSALPPTHLNSPTTSRPAKLIELRSKCYRQLHDLSNLKASGVLTDDEYDEEKTAVLEILKKTEVANKLLTHCNRAIVCMPMLIIV